MSGYGRLSKTVNFNMNTYKSVSDQQEVHKVQEEINEDKISIKSQHPSNPFGCSSSMSKLGIHTDRQETDSMEQRLRNNPFENTENPIRNFQKSKNATPKAGQIQNQRKNSNPFSQNNFFNSNKNNSTSNICDCQNIFLRAQNSYPQKNINIFNNANNSNRSNLFQKKNNQSKNQEIETPTNPQNNSYNFFNTSSNSNKLNIIEYNPSSSSSNQQNNNSNRCTNPFCNHSNCIQGKNKNNNIFNNNNKNTNYSNNNNHYSSNYNTNYGYQYNSSYNNNNSNNQKSNYLTRNITNISNNNQISPTNTNRSANVNLFNSNNNINTDLFDNNDNIPNLFKNNNDSYETRYDKQKLSKSCCCLLYPNGGLQSRRSFECNKEHLSNNPVNERKDNGNQMLKNILERLNVLENKNNQCKCKELEKEFIFFKKETQERLTYLKEDFDYLQNKLRKFKDKFGAQMNSIHEKIEQITDTLQENERIFSTLLEQQESSGQSQQKSEGIVNQMKEIHENMRKIEQIMKKTSQQIKQIQNGKTQEISSVAKALECIKQALNEPQQKSEAIANQMKEIHENMQKIEQIMKKTSQQIKQIQNGKSQEISSVAKALECAKQALSKQLTDRIDKLSTDNKECYNELKKDLHSFKENKKENQQKSSNNQPLTPSKSPPKEEILKIQDYEIRELYSVNSFGNGCYTLEIQNEFGKITLSSTSLPEELKSISPPKDKESKSSNDSNDSKMKDYIKITKNSCQINFPFWKSAAKSLIFYKFFDKNTQTLSEQETIPKIKETLSLNFSYINIKYDASKKYVRIQ